MQILDMNVLWSISFTKKKRLVSLAKLFKTFSSLNILLYVIKYLIASAKNISQLRYLFATTDKFGWVHFILLSPPSLSFSLVSLLNASLFSLKILYEKQNKEHSYEALQRSRRNRECIVGRWDG